MSVVSQRRRILLHRSAARTYLRITMLFIGAGLLSHANAVVADFCGDLRTVMGALPGNFESIRGSSRPNNTWRATASLEGYTDCYLSRGDAQDPGISFRCSTSFIAGESEARAIMKKYAGLAGTCLGPAYRVFNESPDAIGLSDNKAIVAVRVIPQLDVQSARAPGASIREGSAVSLSVFPTHPAEARPADATTIRPFDAAALKRPEFCSTLKGLVAAGAKHFDPIKGKEQGKYWASKEPLPGTQECYIGRLQDGSTYHTCIAGYYRNADSAVATARSAATDVVKCLGAAWNAGEHVVRNRMSIDIEKSDRDAYVSLRVIQGAADKPWSVRIDINEADR